MQPQGSACSFYSRAQWSKKRKRWLYVYVIYPPTASPFFPSDEALKTMVGRLPEIAFIKSERFSDRDCFYIFGLKRCIFSTRADSLSREIRLKFLREVGASSMSFRDVRPLVSEEATHLLRAERFEKIEWNGRHLVATTADGKRLESHLRGRCRTPFKQLFRLCKSELPFQYGAAR